MNGVDTAVVSLEATNALADQMFYKSNIDDQAQRMQESIDRDKRLGERVARSAIRNIELGEQLDNELFLSQLNFSQTSLASFLHVVQTELEACLGGKNAPQ
jgi:hypothetical protein